MSNIIYQIFENYIIDVMGFLSSNKIRKLEELESELKKKSDSLNAQLISTYCEIIDEAIFKDRAGREKKGYVAELCSRAQRRQEGNIYTVWQCKL